jgi:hypothetical protein
LVAVCHNGLSVGLGDEVPIGAEWDGNDQRLLIDKSAAAIAGEGDLGLVGG